MTKYEKISIAISILAFLIPIFQFVYNRFILKAKLLFYTTGRAFLFTNASGSYLRIEGVFEALNKPVSIKNVSVKVKRKRDDAVLNLAWSMLTNPANQQIMGTYAFSAEVAHPFRVDANSIATAFIEYTDFYNTSTKMIKPYLDALALDIQINQLWNGDYNEMRVKYMSLPSYAKALDAVRKELFWQIGSYELIVTAQFGKCKKDFVYEFYVSEDIWNDLNYNVSELLDTYLKTSYRVPPAFKNVQVELKEKA